jgi:DNA invertase Pin-like site-specific DNA recombinase
LKTPKRIELSIRKAHAFGPTYHVPPAASAKPVKRKVRKFITNRMVEKMRELDAHMTRAQIARECGVSRPTVTRVLGWKHYHRRGRLGMRA